MCSPDLLSFEKEIEALATDFADKHHTLFLGRGEFYPIAMEASLKLKEISYIHAEAYAAGELKHGPLALIDADMPVVVVAPSNDLLEKLKSNVEEVYTTTVAAWVPQTIIGFSMKNLSKIVVASSLLTCAAAQAGDDKPMYYSVEYVAYCATNNHGISNIIPFLFRCCYFTLNRKLLVVRFTFNISHCVHRQRFSSAL